MRRPPPIVESRGGLQNERLNKSRTNIGQVISVDAKNGRVKVRMNSTAEEFSLQIPLGGFSIQGLKSSWMRYMPQAKEFVKVGFGADNTPLIEGYTAFGEEYDSSGNRQGSPGPPRQGLYATVRRLAEANVGELGTIFRELREGEFDARSSGGAEYYGSRDGTLTLAGGGGAVLRLIKKRQEMRGRTGLVVWENDGVEVRFGNVKRKLLPTDANESAVTANLAGAPAAKEHKVRVAYKTPPAGTPELVLYEAIHGDVRDGRGIVEALNGTALRTRAQWFNAGGIETLNLRVDALGNVSLVQAAFATASGINLSSNGLTPLSTNFLRTVLTSSTQHVIAAPLVNIGSANAIEPFIMGLRFNAATSTWGTGHIAQSSLLAALCTALIAFLNDAAIAALTASTGTGAAAAAAATALQGTATSMAASLTPNYLSGVSNALSTKIFGE